MKKMTPTSLFAFSILSLCVMGSALSAAETLYYGNVESYGGGQIVVKTTQHSTGTWKVDSATTVTGSVHKWNWVSAMVETSGHVQVLKVEESPTGHSGIVKAINGVVLSVMSGNAMENWNRVETTLGDGCSPSDVAVGDVIGVELYKNHNLAAIRIIKHGVN
jgi:hypothetical protein